jgi:hypothetical protein
VDAGNFAAVVDRSARLSPEPAEGIPLHGEEVYSLPSFDELWSSGSVLLDEILRATGHARADVESKSFQTSQALADYEQEAHRLCPLYRSQSEGLYAVLGGWHIMWPDDDSYDRDYGRLVLWTFYHAEPWVEVWLDNSGNLSVIPRIT